MLNKTRVAAISAAAALLYTACAASAPAKPAVGLSDVYATLATKRFVDLTHTFGPTTPTSWAGMLTVVGSTNDLNPASLICVSRTLAGAATNPGKRKPAVSRVHRR